ncbi:MAG TPA: threonine/serine dehydratase [Gemmatimonadetes bacterium]|nr:threonine/serine dehydratase [Gemmatimonadota bacterium]HIN78853.1 threonine/serine dehydratase [Gemmatimonadota bacterium]
MSTQLNFELVTDAVESLARRTPLLQASELSERLGRPVWLKAECLQVTGSFKVRGAAARLMALNEKERGRGVVACSSGNHGRAVAYVAEQLGIPATVCVPEWVDPVKLQGIRGCGAEAVLAGATFDEAEVHALELSERSGQTYVSAYDDPWVIAGQGTIALEIFDQLGEAPAGILAPLSGGGLLGGIASALHERLGGPECRTVAVSAERAAVMLASVRAGHPVELPEEETLASALAGGIGLDNQNSFKLISQLVHEHVTVTEAQISDAMCYCAIALKLVVEGGGAVAIAAVLGGTWVSSDLRDGPLVILLSGGNVAAETLASVLG